MERSGIRGSGFMRRNSLALIAPYEISRQTGVMRLAAKAQRIFGRCDHASSRLCGEQSLTFG
jgi:hypothetical protein